MKTVKLKSRFVFVPPEMHGRVSIDYKTPGKTYRRVPEAHAAAIVAADCGEIVEKKSAAAEADAVTDVQETEADGKR